MVAMPARVSSPASPADERDSPADERDSPAAERWRFTRAHYHAMGEAGILTPDERVELLAGEIVVMSPIGTRHNECVDTLTDCFSAVRASGARVRVQGALACSEHSEPQPDLMLLVERSYAFEHPGPADVLLLVEVADSSLDFDRDEKLPFYAAAGIREVWLVDLQHDRIEAHSEPAPGGYRVTRRHEPGESLAPLAFPDLTLDVDRILPPRRPPA